MQWYIYALLFSLFFSVIPLRKRAIKYSEENIMFWSSGFVFFLLVLLFALLEFPKDNTFYMIGIVSGVSGVVGGFLQIRLSRQNSGRVMPIQMFVQVLACFVFYSILNPSFYSDIISRPVGSIVVSLCVVLLVGLSWGLRKSDLTVKGIISVIPVGALFAFIVAYYKFMVVNMPVGVENVILVYVMAHFFTMFMFLLIKNLVQKNHFIVVKERLIAESILIALFYVFGYYFLFMSVYFAVNPALVLLFNLLVPVWIKVYSVVMDREDEARMKYAAAIMVVFTIIVITAQFC